MHGLVQTQHWNNAFPTRKGLHFNARQYYLPNITFKKSVGDMWLSVKAFLSFGTLILLTVKGSTEIKIQVRKQYVIDHSGA